MTIDKKLQYLIEKEAFAASIQPGSFKVKEDQGTYQNKNAPGKCQGRQFSF